MWAGGGCSVVPEVAADCSLSPCAAGDSYTQKKKYSSGSVSRPPGRATPYLRTPDASSITEIHFFLSWVFPSAGICCRSVPVAERHLAPAQQPSGGCLDILAFVRASRGFPGPGSGRSLPAGRLSGWMQFRPAISCRGSSGAFSYRYAPAAVCPSLAIVFDAASRAIMG